MKALTNILTRLLMLMLLMLVACTEEAAEVDNLTRGEQYVQVRMQVPGMTAATTRAADGAITSVTALSFNSSDQLLDVKTVNTINNVNANNGYNGNFNLTVPNGTQTIHFLANLPLNYSNEQTYVDFLKAKKGQSQVDVMTSLTTGDYQNLCYWGMATTYDGNTDPLSVTLYRNMAKITLSPSIIDPEFNDAFDETNLYIAGLDNPNLSGKLVPYNNGFYSHYQGVAPDYTTIPDGVQIFDHTYEVTEEGVYGYGRSLYVFEHENSNYIDKGLFVICRIGDAFYKVALTSDGVNPYQIIRNHEYIIYVSDVDDYQTDEYRSTDYYDTFNKTPINLEVKEVEQVAFNANATNINVNGNLTVTVDVPQDGTVTALTISAPGFTIKQGETILGNDGSYTGSDLTITGNNTTYTFVPNTFGQGKEITFTASGTNLQETEQTISVNVTAAIYAGIENNSTLYYDQDNQTVTVNVTMPKGLSAINIGGAENFTVTTTAEGTFTDNTYTRSDASAEQVVQFVFTLDKSKYTSQQGNTSATFTFSDARMVDESDKATQAPVSVNLKPTFTYIDNPTLNMNNNETYTVTMNVGGSLTSLSIAAEGFTVASSSGELTDPTNNVYSYAGGTTTFTFTPTSAGSSTIRFYDGQGENINVPEKNIIVTVNAKIEAAATPENPTLYYDSEDPQTVTVNVTIPKGVTALDIDADDFMVKQGEVSLTYDGTKGVYTYSRGDATTQVYVDFVFTLKDDVTADSSITFSDASDNEYVEDGEVEITVTAQTNETTLNWPSSDPTNHFNLGEKLSNFGTYLKEGNTISVYFEIVNGATVTVDFVDGWEGFTLKSCGEYSGTGEKIISLPVDSTLLSKIGDYQGNPVAARIAVKSSGNITLTKVVITKSEEETPAT